MIFKIYKHFYLKNNCKDNIIINSKSGWWAAFLNSNPNNIVISPNKLSSENIINS